MTDHDLDRLLDDLDALVTERGAPGDEYDVAERYADLIAPHVDSVQMDDAGNVIATQEGDGEGREMMLAAHTDELAFMIDGITDDGFLRFRWLGAHYPGNFAGQQVVVGPDAVPGVIGAKSRHRMDDDEVESLPEEWYIDVGAPSADAVEALNIRPGDFATWDRGYTQLANGRLAGRAMDDRLGLAVLTEVARRTDPDATVRYVATVQEEPGLRGAEMTGYTLDPDIALAVDIFPGDHPGDDDRVEADLGGGPAVELAEGVGQMLNGVLVNRQVREWLRRAADRAEVTPQYTVFQHGFTDARVLQTVRGGRHAGVVSVPCRYTHSPVETVARSDIAETTVLLARAVEEPFPSRAESR